MPNYRRFRAPGASYFFTVNLEDRRDTLLVDRIDDLRAAVRHAMANRAFEIVAMVVLPDHLHMLMALPAGEADDASRWSAIKSMFSRRVPKTRDIRHSLARKRERGIWQRRFYEHCMRDQEDLWSHINYIHYNPVKHGYVKRPMDWSFSSIHRFVRNGWLPAAWGDGDLRLPEIRVEGERR